ncbi:unnamed protein product [Cuscuta europaea]|uniref:Uncharacterized protein n=1 Tax=Cuscuta europaea TaxID=41803 RepID=A0A9P1E9J1_CUSEU|nr:unnamed protein product [Cuscuta europaea]
MCTRKYVYIYITIYIYIYIYIGDRHVCVIFIQWSNYPGHPSISNPILTIFRHSGRLIDSFHHTVYFLIRLDFIYGYRVHRDGGGEADGPDGFQRLFLHRHQHTPPATGLSSVREAEICEAGVRILLRVPPGGAGWGSGGGGILWGDAGPPGGGRVETESVLGGGGVRGTEPECAGRYDDRGDGAVGGGGGNEPVLGEAAATGVPGGFRVLQTGGAEKDVGGGVPEDDGAERVVFGRHGDVPEEDIPAVGAGRRDVPACGHHGDAAEPVDERGAGGGGGGDVRGAGLAVRGNGGEGRGDRDPDSELQPVQPDAVAGVDDREPLQAAGEREQLQPGRNGVLGGAHIGGPGEASAEGEPEHVRGGGEHREHHPQLVLRQRPLHAAVQLHLPDGGRGDAAVEQAAGQGAVQVRAGAHGAHPQGGRRQQLQVRVPEGGRGGGGGGVAGEGADGGGGGRAEDEHHDPGAPGAPAHGAAQVPGDSGEEEGDGAEGEGEAVHPGLQAGVRALLHPRGRAGGAGRAAEQPGPHRVAHGAVADDSAPLRQHLQQLAVVRAGLHGSQRPGVERRPRVADRLRLRLQVQ